MTEWISEQSFTSSASKDSGCVAAYSIIVTPMTNVTNRSHSRSAPGLGSDMALRSRQLSRARPNKQSASVTY
jgi:hypothetical protein